MKLRVEEREAGGSVWYIMATEICTQEMRGLLTVVQMKNNEDMKMLAMKMRRGYRSDNSYGDIEARIKTFVRNL